MTYRYGTAGDLGVSQAPVQNPNTNIYEHDIDCSTGTVFEIDLAGQSTDWLKDPTNITEGVEYTFILKQPASSYTQQIGYEAAWQFPIQTHYGTQQGHTWQPNNTWHPPVTNVSGAIDIIYGVGTRDSYGDLVLVCGYDANVYSVYTPEYGMYTNTSSLLLDNATTDTQYCEATDATHLDITSTIGGPSALSISVWIRPTSASAPVYESIVSKMDATGKGYDLSYENGQIVFTVSDGAGGTSHVVSATTLTTDLWYHVVGSFNGQGGQQPYIYINGVTDVSTSSYGLQHGASISNTAMFNIGRNEGLYPNSNFFTGNIDSVSIWGWPLSQWDSTNIYTGSTGEGFTDNLRNPSYVSLALQKTILAWYRFGDEATNAYIGTPDAPTTLETAYNYASGNNWGGGQWVFYSPQQSGFQWALTSWGSWTAHIRVVADFAWAPAGTQSLEWYDFWSPSTLVNEGVYDPNTQTITFYTQGTSGGSLQYTFSAGSTVTTTAPIVVDEGYWKLKPRKHLTPIGMTLANLVLDTPEPPPVPFTNNYSLRFNAQLQQGGYANDSSDVRYTESDTWCLSLWFRADTDSTARNLVHKWDNSSGYFAGYEMYLSASGKLIFVISDDYSNQDYEDVQSDNIVADDKWHHVVITIAQGSLVMWIDGAQQTGSTTGGGNGFPWGNSTQYNSNYQYLWLSHYQNSNWSSNPTGTTFYTGWMDEISFWNDALTAAEIKTIYNYGQPNDLAALTPSNATLVTWYRCGEKVGTTHDSYSTMVDHATLGSNNDYFQWGSQSGTGWSYIAYDPTSVPKWDDSKSISLGQHGRNSTYFDRSAGTGQSLEAPNVTDLDFDGNSPFSVSIWCNPDSQTKDPVQSSECLVSKTPGVGGSYTGWHILDYGAGAGALSAFFYTSYPSDWVSVSANQALPANTWSHVVLVYTHQADIKIYVNGVDSSTLAATNGTLTTFSNSAVFCIGQDYGGSIADRSYQGKLDEVSIWEKALSPIEVLFLYNGGAPTDLTSQVSRSVPLPSGNLDVAMAAWWRMGDDPDDDLGVIVKDQVHAHVGMGPLGNQPGWSGGIDLVPQGGMTDASNRSVDSPTSGTGTYLEAAWPASTGKSVYFDAAQQQYIQAASNTALDFDGSAPFTVSFWVKPNFAQTNMLVTYGLSKSMFGSPYTGWSIYWYGASLNFQCYGSSGGYLQHYGTSPTPQGQWTHIACVYTNQTTMQVYADGVLQSFSNGGNSLTGNVFNNSEYFKIGNLPGYTGNSQNGAAFDGNIDDVSVWNTNLTQPQIQEIYGNGSPNDLYQHSYYLSTPGDLLSWWQMGYAGDSFDNQVGVYDPLSGQYLADGSASMTNATNLLTDSAQPIGGDPAILSSTLDLSNVFTISFWIQQTDVTGFDFILTKTDNPGNGQPGIQIYNNAGVVYADFVTSWSSNWGQLTSSPGILSDRRWHHIGIVYKGVGVGADIYVDGLLDNSDALAGLSSGAANTAEIFNIGRRPDQGTTNAFDGKLDEVSIWSIDMQGAGVTELYNKGVPRDLSSHSQYANIVSWWRIGDYPERLVAGGRVIDMISASGNDLAPRGLGYLSAGGDVPTGATNPIYIYVNGDWDVTNDSTNFMVLKVDQTPIGDLDLAGAVTGTVTSANNSSVARATTMGGAQTNGAGAVGSMFDWTSTGDYEVEFNLPPGDYLLVISDQGVYNWNWSTWNVEVQISDQSGWGNGNVIYPVFGSPDDTSGNGTAYTRWDATPEYYAWQQSGTIAPSLFSILNNPGNATFGQNGQLIHKFTVT